MVGADTKPRRVFSVAVAEAVAQAPLPIAVVAGGVFTGVFVLHPVYGSLSACGAVFGVSSASVAGVDPGGIWYSGGETGVDQSAAERVGCIRGRNAAAATGARLGLAAVSASNGCRGRAATGPAPSGRAITAGGAAYIHGRAVGWPIV